MDKLNSLFVLSWSPKQKCFHIEQVKDMLKTNLMAFKKKYPVDFIPLAFTTSFENANAIRIEFEAQIK